MASLLSLRSEFRQRRQDSEQQVVESLLAMINLNSEQTTAIQSRAAALVNALRDEAKPGLMESFLAEYGLSTDEGVALMCLAEAYLRTPDDLTMDALIRDKIGAGQWSRHRGGADSPFVNVSTWALMLSGRVFRNKKGADKDLGDIMLKVVQRLGEPVARVAVGEAMKLMGRQFVLGRDIDEAIDNGQNYRNKGYRYSYDMLGEAARTQADAQRYFLSYSRAISSISQHASYAVVHDNPGISVKLSALHPRYEFVQHERVMRELVPRMAALSEQARAANIGLNIDAEEMDRLDISLDVIEAVLRSSTLAGWDGFGVVVQAYSKQAICVLDWLYQLAGELDRKITVRLVKGAYWDTEIKNAQVQGLERYPVFTQKPTTDVSYLACAKRLMAYSDRIYPQFATHNAQTVSAILELADEKAQFEFQRLHGMGEALHDLLLDSTSRRSRIYAPVGVHKDLLAYLVRRLLENGANSSFVNQVLDRDVPVDVVVGDPVTYVRGLEQFRNLKIPLPAQIYAGKRINSHGWNLNDPLDAQMLESKMSEFRHHRWKAAALIANVPAAGQAEKILSPVDRRDVVGEVTQASVKQVHLAIDQAQQAFAGWSATPVEQRVAILKKTADLYEQNAGELMALASREAGKTRLDGVSEVREAVDFLRYYADQACEKLQQNTYSPLGPVVCISPWNFPLAIFTGQITAALAAGNTVLAKPAEQTPLISTRAVELFQLAGLPDGVLTLLPGLGETVGASLTSDPGIKGVWFTGSTQTAMYIDQALAKKGDAKAPLVAETGGLNAMIVDSSALPEQAVRDIVQSAFQSAGQRCSALRLLIVQEDVADHVLEMLEGAANELVIGDSWNPATDVGPVIDNEAQQSILDYMNKLDGQGRCLFKSRLPHGTELGTYVPVAAYKLDNIEDLKEEIFGPVLHVVRFKAADLDKVVEQINASGYGLTLGAHSRVDERMDRICSLAEVGNIYLNRNQIGAVVGVQPFGGEGLSGTGPKAGGPHYMYRFLKPRKTLNKYSSEHLKAIPAGLLAAISKLDGQLKEIAENAICRVAEVVREPQILTGPTGERNTYTLHPRGTVVCAGGGSDKQAALFTQCILSAMAGNSVIIPNTDAETDIAQNIRKFLTTAGVDKAQISLSKHDLLTLCQTNELDLVIIDDEDITELRKVLASRAGARIPVLCSSDPAQLHFMERVVSEDTTASGGNAKLLAGV